MVAGDEKRYIDGSKWPGITLINLKSQDLPRKPAGFSIIAGSFTEISIPTRTLKLQRISGPG